MTDSDQDYWRHEGLDRLFELYEDPGRDDHYHATAGKAKIAFTPQVAGLVRLHRLIRERMATTVLEFGVGFSAVVMADALVKNQADFEALSEPPKIRNTKAFQLFAVDARQHWIAETRKRIPPALSGRVHFNNSRVVIGMHNGQLCHFYEALQNVIPDFIYCDGPSPKDVEGSINGPDFSIDERTVISGDLLLMESTMLPQTFIIVDGRVNNARFLQRNFTRNFVHRHDPVAGATTFEPDEPPLGRHSHDLATLVKAQRNH